MKLDSSNKTNIERGNYAYLMGDDEYTDNGSIASRSLASHVPKNRIRPWEPTFTSTFALFYQTSLFGLLLFVVYIIDNHPPHGAARSQSGTAGSSYNLQFDEDQFIFWFIIFMTYAYVISWKRNDGRPIFTKSDPVNQPKMPRRKSESTNSLANNSQSHNSRNRTSRKSGTASVASGTSTQASDDINQKLEEVLLDADEKSFDNILDTINDDINKTSLDSNPTGWLEEGSKLLGLDELNDDTKSVVTTIQNVKPENDILNRCQTLEWKGMLSAALLLYHYNSGGIHQMSSNNEDGYYSDDGSFVDGRAHIYENLSKVGMTSFLFMTGYSHTSYYYYQDNRNSYGLCRVMDVIFRINWAALFLALAVGKAEYVACPMITYWFTMVWMTMRYQSSMNYDKIGFRLKFLGLACYIFLMWDCDITKAFIPDQTKQSFKSLWKCYGVSHLHHWAAFVGMVFAINQPIASLQLRKLESLGVLQHILAKGLIITAMSLAVFLWSTGPLKMSMAAYNMSQPYFGIIPVLAFVYLRNVNATTREHHIGLLSWLGKYSLEVYLLHHHVFTDTGCVVFIAGYPRCNFLFVTLLLLFAARVLHRLTTILRHMVLSKEDERQCMQSAVRIVGGLTILYLLGKALSWADMVSVGTISTITVVCGILLYQTILDITWAEYRENGLEVISRNDDLPSDRIITVTMLRVPLVATTAFVLALCMWFFSSSGSQMCGATANIGHWVPLNPCLSRGKLHRGFDAINYISPSECSESNDNLQWTWLENRQHTHCNYRYHSDAKIQHKLKGKTVILVGDSSVRNLFQSLCRFFGDHNAIGYGDTSPSHSDTIKNYGSTTLEYKWAPLTVDVVTKLKSLKNTGFTAHTRRRPDLVIAGGGAWDRLHLSVTDEDQQSQQETVTKLVKSLSDSAVPVVWFTPPTINTQALNSDEKRIQMSEESIQEMRYIYEQLGVNSAASFVLDGPSFTRERATESHDGVHYPPSVYDAGTQILMNALDWLLASPNSAGPELILPRPVPYLGMMMLCIATIGLFFFDGYFGFSYLAQFFVIKDSVSPGEMYDDAFSPLLQRLKINQKDESVDTPSYESYDNGNGSRAPTERSGRSLTLSHRRR